MVTTNRETEIRIKEMLKDLLIPDKENIQIFFVKDFLNNPPIHLIIHPTYHTHRTNVSDANDFIAKGAPVHHHPKTKPFGRQLLQQH